MTEIVDPPQTDGEFDWYGPDAATFGDRLAASRQAVDMSQKDLARRLGVKLATLRAWEDDLSEPRANRLTMMSGLLNVSLSWLLTGEGEGLDNPVDFETGGQDLAALLTEVRDTKTQLRGVIEKLGRLEKRLRDMQVQDPE